MLFDPTGLQSLSYDEMRQIVRENNHSPLSDALILCIAWNESNFNPLNGSQNFGKGLMGLSSPATDQVNHDLGAPDTLSGTYLYEGWSDPGLNIEIATQYSNT
jgi:hypothetical protein